MHIAQFSGPGAKAALTDYVARDIASFPKGRVRYCLRLDSSGKVLSDLTVWKINQDTYHVISGQQQDIKDLLDYAGSQVCVEDLSEHLSVFAVQGPASLATLVGLCEEDRLTGLNYYEFCDVIMCEVPVRVARLGYTKERGLEIIVDTAQAPPLWHNLAARAAPAGFATADILRIEAGFVLFCNEFAIDVTASEVAMERFAGGSVIGSESELILVCFFAEASEKPVLWRHPDPQPKRPSSGELLVTSACYSPLAGGVLGLGYVNTVDIHVTDSLVEPLGVFHDPILCARPFVDPGKRVVRDHWADDLLPCE
jgi:glycine cleavage system aminomethyltransferase T